MASPTPIELHSFHLNTMVFGINVALAACREFIFNPLTLIFKWQKILTMVKETLKMKYHPLYCMLLLKGSFYITTAHIFSL